MVIESEVVAGNDIDTSILLDLPVGKTKPLGLGKEIGLGDLSAPVCGQEVRTGANLRRIQEEEKKKRRRLTSLGSLLQVTEDTHAGETENGGLDHLDCRLRNLVMGERVLMRKDRFKITPKSQLRWGGGLGERMRRERKEGKHGEIRKEGQGGKKCLEAGEGQVEGGVLRWEGQPELLERWVETGWTGWPTAG